MAEELNPRLDQDAALEAWREVMKADARAESAQARLEIAQRQIFALRQLVARVSSTPSEGDLGIGVLEGLFVMLSCNRGAVWLLGPANFRFASARGVPSTTLKQLTFPAPNPFQGPFLSPPQGTWFPTDGMPEPLSALKAGPEEALYFVPLEHQLLLVGFVILVLPKGRIFESRESEDLDFLQRVFAMAFHARWMLQDLGSRRQPLSNKVPDGDLKGGDFSGVQEGRWGHLHGAKVRMEFLRFATEELRRRLSEMLVFLKLGLDGAYNEDEVGSAFEDCFQMGKHMQGLLSDLVIFTEGSESGRDLQLAPVDPTPLLRKLQDSLGRVPMKEGAQILWPDLRHPLPKIKADGEALREILTTLLGLQRDSAAGQQEGLRLEFRAKLFRMRIPLPNIDPVLSWQILEVFQSDSPDTLKMEELGGVGLSFVVCRQIMREMEGDLVVEAEGSGCSVSLDLPLA